jgi:16S rRNA (cytidine1402-2'-O)-methyltransferase
LNHKKPRKPTDGARSLIAEEHKKGALYVIATPVGNLGDVSSRTRETLGRLDWLATESGPSARRLLSALEIPCPHLESFREDNREQTETRILDALSQGLQVGLICEAGTPAISDPGWTLVRACHKEGYVVLGIPGPSAVILALSVAGQPTRQFFYEGFLPRANPRRRQRLEFVGSCRETVALLESPHGLLKTLEDLARVRKPANPITIARELTKKFEEVNSTSLEQALSYYTQSEPRGEFVIVLGPSEEQADAPPPPEAAAFQAKVDWLREQGLTNRQLGHYLTEFEKVPRKDSYRFINVDSAKPDF